MTDPDNTVAFSPIEEDFFRAGDAISEAAVAEPRETAPASESVWSRLFKRKPRPVIAIARRASTSV